MPGLVICGRRSSMVAGDDLGFVCTLTIGLRIIEIILLVPAAVIVVDDFFHDFECVRSRSDRALVGALPAGYLASSIAVALLSILVDAVIIHISGKGSPTQPELRKGVAPLFAFQLFVMPFLLLALVVGGIVVITYVSEVARCLDIPGSSASKPDWFVTMTTAVSLQFVETFIYMAILIYRMQAELRQRASRGEEGAPPDDLAQDVEEWEKCCRCCCKYTALCCCFSFGGRGIQYEDFHSMSETLADLFQGWTLDVVPSDVRMAMNMLALLQEERKQDCVEQLKAELADTSLRMDRELNTCFFDVSPLSLNLGNLSDTWKRALKIVKKSDDIENSDGSIGGDNQVSVSEVDAQAQSSSSNVGRSQILAYKLRNDGDGVHYDFKVRSVMSPDHDGDRYVIAEGAHFIRYSVAVNTWKNFMFTRPKTGICELTYATCSLATGCHQESSGGTDYPITAGDHCCRLHEAALLHVVGFDRSKVELAYAYFNKHARAEEAVYAILIDHVWRSVVLCIRGSLSLGDYVVNLDIAPENLESTGEECSFDGSGEFCHRGYLARAKWIMEDLKRHNILEDLLSEDSGKHKDYQFRITGHSLGAGCAAPLALMLRSRYPRLRCLCYGPPGSLLSVGTARGCGDFVTTFVCNADLVPRISAGSVRLLRDEVLDLIARIRVPKREVTRMHGTYARDGRVPRGTTDACLRAGDDVPESDFAAQLARFRKRASAREKGDGGRRVSLYPPGRVIHMVKTSSKDRYREMFQGHFLLSDIFNALTCGRFIPKEEYVPRRADVEDFNEIVVCPTLISDHMVENVQIAIGGIAKAFGIDPSEPPKYEKT